MNKLKSKDIDLLLEALDTQVEKRGAEIEGTKQVANVLEKHGVSNAAITEIRKIANHKRAELGSLSDFRMKVNILKGTLSQMRLEIEEEEIITNSNLSEEIKKA